MALSRKKAIREKCIDCCGGQTKEVRLCTCTTCPLYPFRMGKAEKEEENDEEGILDREE